MVTLQNAKSVDIRVFGEQKWAASGRPFLSVPNDSETELRVNTSGTRVAFITGWYGLLMNTEHLCDENLGQYYLK